MSNQNKVPRFLATKEAAQAFEAKVDAMPSLNKTAIDALVKVTAANATDLASAQTLANANKVAINAIIDALKGA